MTQNRHSIVGFIADEDKREWLPELTKENQFVFKWIGDANEIGEFEPDVPKERPGEVLYGRKGRLLTRLVAWQPILLIFDLANDQIPWGKWIPVLKSSPATRRMTIICLVEEAEQAELAADVGVEHIFGWHKITAVLLQKLANIPDYTTLQSACDEPISELAIEGLELFNRREYFECHEALEDAWKADKGAGRDLYRGILQIGIAYMQIERGNFRGAVKMLLRVRQWLDPLPPTCRGIQVEPLRQDARIVHDALVELGAEKIAEFDKTLFRPVQFTLS